MDKDFLFKIIFNHCTNSAETDSISERFEGLGEHAESHLMSPWAFHVLAILSLEIQMSKSLLLNTDLGMMQKSTSPLEDVPVLHTGEKAI